MITIGTLCGFFLLLKFRMERPACSYLVSCIILSSFLFKGIEACWGRTAPGFGNMTADYDLLVGSDLILNCTLKKLNFSVFPRNINSSDLVIEKENLELSNFTRVINERTIQLKIPNATVNDTGFYICMIVLKENKTVVCPSKVNVGYPPHPVKEFSCISRNFDNLNCTWSTKQNNVSTTYTIVKNLYNVPTLHQRCPDSTKQPNSCEWSTKTDPTFVIAERKMSFTITGNNSLGNYEEDFAIDGYSIVIPNGPESLEALHISQRSVTLKWKPPIMRNMPYDDFPLKYQIWISKPLYDSSAVLIYNITDGSKSFSIEDLIPHVTYNVSLRCRSNYTENDTMWSGFTSVAFKTLADVPYKPPEVIPEAFEIHIYKESRSATLYWKAVPQLYHNGDAFHYHIKYYKDDHQNTSNIYSINTSISFINIKNLEKDFPYTFQIYSANEKGISVDYGSIFIDSEEKITPAPKEVRVISEDTGRYNLTWIPPNDIDDFNYIVFWCPSLTPWQSRCDNSIQWTDKRLSETNVVLNLSAFKTNFQFAVASESNTGSSGMQWASCIVPHKGGVSKIKYVKVEPKNSTSMKVIWNLDCPAEKAVVNKYEITYCGVKKHKECHMVRVEPNADNFVLENLHPFTNYSIKIRAINNHNKTSEDSDEVYQSTLPGAPSGSPKIIHVSSNSKDAIFVRWTPPLEPNGIITEYIVSYNGSKRHVEVTSAQTEYNTKIDGLKPFYTYAVQLQACVNHDCSVKSDPIMIRTEIDAPGYMEPPRIIEVNSTHVNVSWKKPTAANGPIDFYVIKWQYEQQNVTSVSDNTFNVSGENSVVLDVKCSYFGDEGIKYLFYIQAVNKKNGTNLYGPFSDSTQVKACFMPEGIGMFIGTIVGAAFGAIFFLVGIYQFVKWMKSTIRDDFRVIMPKGLDGPDTSSLNNYKGIQNGDNVNLRSNNSERPSFFIDENKNRHGSGSSQFSNSSTEELAFRNGKCTKFGRKPSGDSSGCSSMSSSITPRIHLSSDSGTESDFVIPPSPDSAITEPNFHNCHKNPLPILIEVNDHQSLEKNITMSPEKQYHKHKNAVDDVILKIDPPYSKFGYAGNATSSLPWPFYNCKLANSEPSVFGTDEPQKNETVAAPYSKVGLAKSSGNISLANVNQIGYSKFGFPQSQKRFSIPPSNPNVVAMVMLENPAKKEWSTIKKLLDDKYQHHKLNKDKALTPPNYLTEDTGYIKVATNKICANLPSKGYVPFNEVRDQMHHDQSFIVRCTDQTNIYNSSPNGNDQNYFPDDTEWLSFNNCEEENKNIDNPEILVNVAFAQNSIDCVPVGETVLTTSNSGCSSPLGYPKSNDLLPEVASDSDIKLNSISPTLSRSEISFENNSLLQQRAGSLPNSVLNTTRNSMFEESHSSGNTNSKSDCGDIPNEVIVTPVTLKNGYVPFQSLADSRCDNNLSYLPNNSKLTNPPGCLSNGVCSERDNYITSPHNGDLNFLRQNPLPKTVPFVSKQDSVDNTQKLLQNGNGYASLSLRYILKPIPKMESEICEV